MIESVVWVARDRDVIDDDGTIVAAAMDDAVADVRYVLGVDVGDGAEEVEEVEECRDVVVYVVDGVVDVIGWR